MSVFKGVMQSGHEGKTGSYVGYYRMGKWIVRNLPKRTQKNKIGSETQNIYRNRFKNAQGFVKPITPLLKMGYSEMTLKTGLTGHNLAMSQLLKEAFDEQGNIDITKFLFSQGSLPPLPPIALQHDEDNISLHWDPKINTNNRGENDQLLILIYDHIGGYVLFQGTDVLRKAGKTSFSTENPSNKNCEFHIWVACINNDRSAVSNSQYVGMVKI